MTILYPDICAKNLRIMENLPAQICPSQVQPYVTMLQCAPYTQILRTLDKICEPGYVPNARTMERVRELAQKAQEFEDYEYLFSMPEGYQARLIKPGAALEEVMHVFLSVPNCMIFREKEHTGKVKWIQQDINLGACYLMHYGRVLGTSDDPKVLMHSYVAVTKKGKPTLFLDSIESGNIHRAYINDWEDRGNEIIYAFASMAYLADKFGISDIAFGDCEFEELGELTGIGRSNLFLKKALLKLTIEEQEAYFQGFKERKIGFPGDSSEGYNGPYLSKLGGINTAFRVFNLEKFRVPDPDELRIRINEFKSKYSRLAEERSEALEIYEHAIEMIIGKTV